MAAALGQDDDRVFGVVVLLQPQRLAVERSVELFDLVLEALEPSVVLAPVLGDRLRQVIAEEAQALGAEDAPAHEVEQLVEDEVLLDLQRARVAGDLGGDVAAAGAEAAAVPLRALLVGALHATLAKRAAHAAAKHVQAPGPAAVALAVALRRFASCSWRRARSSTSSKSSLGTSGSCVGVGLQTHCSRGRWNGRPRRLSWRPQTL
jgi:hypothetical protein